MYGLDRKKNVKATVIYSLTYAVIAIVMSCVYLYAALPRGAHVIMMFLPLSCLAPMVDIMIAHKKISGDTWISLFMGKQHPEGMTLIQRVLSFDTLWFINMFSLGCSLTLTYAPGLPGGSFVIACSTFVMIGIIHGVHILYKNSTPDQVSDNGNSIVAEEDNQYKQVKEDVQNDVQQSPVNEFNEQYGATNNDILNNNIYHYGDNNSNNIVNTNTGETTYSPKQMTGILGFEQPQVNGTGQYGDINGMDTFRLLSTPL